MSQSELDLCLMERAGLKPHQQSARFARRTNTCPANAAAFAVGYESPSQFSREFKAYFGVTTGQARESAYAFIRST